MRIRRRILRPVKPWRPSVKFERLLIGYRTDYRLALWLRLASPIINGFSNIKKHLANFEYIHTEHLALDEVKQSLCCYFHRGYRITNLILK